MRKIYQVPLILFSILFTAAILFVMFFFTSALLCVKDDLVNQITRINILKAAYASGQAEKVDEQQFCTFSLSEALENNMRFDKIQVLGTHNSYKTQKSPVEKLYSAFSEGLREGNYSNLTPTEQLNAGIRALEIDLFYTVQNGKTKFRCFHIAGLDMSSNAYDFELFLQEVNMWSNYNPGHLPVSIHIETKLAGALPPYKLLTQDQLADFDEVVRKNIDNLYTPQMAEKNYASAQERNSKEPIRLKDVMGKVLFITNGNDYLCSWKFKGKNTHVIFEACRLLAFGYYSNRVVKWNCYAFKTDFFDPSSPNCEWMEAPGKTVRLRSKYKGC